MDLGHTTGGGGAARAFAYPPHSAQSQPGLTMAPPPAKMRYPPLSQQHEKIYEHRQIANVVNENALGGFREGSEAAWSTEEEGLY